MKIIVRVKPNSKENAVEKARDGEFTVRVKAPALEGRANAAAIEALSGYLRIAKSRIRIVRGRAGKSKLVQIS